MSRLLCGSCGRWGMVLGNNVKKDFRKTRACLLGIYSSMFFLNDLLFLEIFV